MKKIARTTILLALTLTTALGMPKEPVLTATEGSKTLILSWEGSPGAAAITIMDEDGGTVHSEKVHGKTDYAKKFDLGNLPPGNYFLKAEDALKEIVYTLAIDRHEVRVTGKKERFKPSFRKEGSRIFLNYLNLEKRQVHISVYDADHRMLHSEIMDGQSIGRSFDFISAVEGDYVIELGDGEHRYGERVTIE